MYLLNECVTKHIVSIYHRIHPFGNELNAFELKFQLNLKIFHYQLVHDKRHNTWKIF